MHFLDRNVLQIVGALVIIGALLFVYSIWQSAAEAAQYSCEGSLAGELERKLSKGEIDLRNRLGELPAEEAAEILR